MTDIKKLYSASTKGFYSTDFHTADKIPLDAVNISDELYHSLLSDQALGYIIVADEDGVPYTVHPSELRTLDEAKEIRKRYINVWRDEALTQGFVFNSVLFDCDAKAQNNLTSLVAAVSAGVPLPDDFTWRSFDNEDVPMNAETLVQFAGYMLAHTNSIYSRSFKLKNLVDTKTTKSSIAAINWDTSVE